MSLERVSVLNEGINNSQLNTDIIDLSIDAVLRLNIKKNPKTFLIIKKNWEVDPISEFKNIK